jgi:3-methylcrotonyl-CoA carboxylase alpha subunit
MGEAAVRAAREIGYVGAGTVEFLLDADGSFYFMEMNTRLQVEHPVTEMITGQDLVEWQLRVAMGERLPLAQDELTITGHSFEARLYAEDPEQDFLPATGRLERFAMDLKGAGLDPRQVRLDSGVETGDAVSMHYDPMLAKLIVHGDDRNQALSTLNRALAALDVQGVVTNRAFLQRLATHPAFRNAELDTRFIEKNEATLFAPKQYSIEEYAGAALIGLNQLARECESDSPWDRHDGFRLNAPHTIRISLCDPSIAQVHDAEGVVVVEGTRASGADPWDLTIGGETLTARLQHLEGDAVAVTLNGHRRRLQARRDGNVVVMVDPRGETRLFWRRIDAIDHGHHEAESTLTAPMHGTVVALLVEAGQKVEKGMPLMVMEAMKMEHTMTAPADGHVASFHFAAGDTVGQGDVLLEFAPEE